MKVVILAAGAGKRFKKFNLPKPLTRLANGKSILELQLETLSKYILMDDIFVVVGYCKEKVMEQFPNLLFVYNPIFEEENTAKSLLRALKKIDDDVLWLNGDVVFHPQTLDSLLNYKKTCMLVNKAEVADEEVKYRTNPEGKILEVSKELEMPEGEALGLNFFKKEDLKVLKKNLELCKTNDYFERAIELCIEQGIDVWSVPVEIDKCREIDFPEDLEKANKILWN